jgi:hypothetical protein
VFIGRAGCAGLLTTIMVAAGISAASAQAARDYVSVVGSSTVYPFSTVVAERFGRNSDFKTPKIESTGTGGGFKLFCAGIGVQHPDISNASRRIKQSEVDDCASNGVENIVEVKLGYDGRWNRSTSRWPGTCRTPTAVMVSSPIPIGNGPISIRLCQRLKSRFSAPRRPPVRGMRSSSSSWKSVAKVFPQLLRSMQTR